VNFLSNKSILSEDEKRKKSLIVLQEASPEDRHCFQVDGVFRLEILGKRYAQDNVSNSIENKLDVVRVGCTCDVRIYLFGGVVI